MQVSEMSNVRWAEEDVTRYSDGESAEDSESVRGKQVALGEHRIAPAPPVQIQILDPRLLATAPVGTINVHKSKGVTIGTNISNITVDNREKVKGHFVGLELVSLVDRSRAVRCSFAVCACWIFIVAAGVLYFLLHAIFATESKVIDLDLACWHFIVHSVKSTTRVERYASALISALLLLCLCLGLYFSAQRSLGSPEDHKEGPQKWYINRTEWLAAPPSGSMSRMIKPLPLVVINHSTTPPCKTFNYCAAEMRHLQAYCMQDLKYSDISYNFVVGNDGRVYEGRGWEHAAAHTFSYNTCAVGFGFIGDYRSNGTMKTELTAEQIVNFNKFLAQGVKLGHLRSDYVILGHCDLHPSLSPGDQLYNVMVHWQHYDRTRYSGMNCQQIMQANSSD